MFVKMLGSFLCFFLLGASPQFTSLTVLVYPCLFFFFAPLCLLPHLPPPYIPLFLPLLPVSHSLTPSLPSLSLSAVHHGDYHSTHRVRPDSQILLSTILHHLLLVGATEGEKLRQRQKRRCGWMVVEGGWVGWGCRRISGMKGKTSDERMKGERGQEILKGKK